MRELPRGGYTGLIPKWPIGAPLPGEQDLWERLWRTPQAAAWAELKIEHEVAMYARAFIRGSNGNIGAMQVAARASDRLGLNPNGMMRLRWRIAPDEVGNRRTAREADQPERRPRPRAVEGG
jgi:hypothetical protein